MEDDLQRYRFIAENSLDLICETTLEGVYTFLSPSYLDVLGYEPAQLLGHHFGELVHADDREELLLKFSKHASSLEPGEATFRHQHADGTWRWLEVLGKPIQDVGGNARAVFVSRDITERRETEYRLQEERLKRSKLESLAVLAGGITHDFNNLLTALMGNISLAQMDAPPNTPLAEHLGEAEEACMRMRDLVAELGTFARGGDPVKKPIRIEQAIRTAVRAATRGVEVHCNVHIEPKLHAVNADEGQMTQVFQSLLANARQAMPAGGTIEIDARNSSGAGSLPAGQYIAVRVTDHGTGIARENLGRVFEPYFTTRKEGHGLGLATAHAIVANHGGALLAESIPGAGATFTIYLPAAEAAALPTRAEPLREILPGRILLMDDDESIRVLVSRILAGAGFQVDAAMEGADATRRHREALEAGKPYDLVLLDLRVPGGMGGLEALQVIRTIDPVVRAIVSSGFSENPVTAHYQELGIAAIVPKPYHAHELLKTVRQILASRPA
jgi:PAS domain S-box-containing protein